MNAITKLSTKGQVVIPSDMRAAMGWPSGTELEVIQQPDGVLLRASGKTRPKISFEEFRRRMPRYEGPPLTIEDMNAAIERLAAEDYARNRKHERG